MTGRAANALAAGCDVALHCNGDMAEMEAVAAGSAPLTDAALARLDRGREMADSPDSPDFAALGAKLAALMPEAAG